MSHVAQIKAIQQLTRQRVMQLLDWSELQYGEFQMQQAEAYIQFMIGDDARGANELKQTPSFWAWWRNHWHRRDAQFVNDIENLSQQETIWFYEITHNAKTIEYTPHSVVFAQALAKRLEKEVYQ